MPMYQLKPSFAPDFDVTPKEICYRLTPYHDLPSSASKSEESQATTETDPVKILEQKQHVLIEKLKAQAESLSKLLAVFGKSTEKKQPAAPASAPAATEPPKDAKKDKDAKKEARKAAKNDAKQKVASGDAVAPQGKGKASAEAAWTVEDDRKTWTTGMSLTANIPTTLVAYPQEALGPTTLTITEKDQKWVKALAAIGEKRNVGFTGSVSNKVGSKDAKTTVAVKTGPSFSLNFGKTTIKSHQTAWKVLGAALGLFSRKSAQTFNSAHQALWLDKAEKVLSGTGDLSFFEREASQFLARFDSLSSQWDVTVADIVFRSLLARSELHSNNVEIWAKRIDALSS